MTEGRAVRPEKTEAWTVQQVLNWAAEDFRSRKFDAPRLDAELLLAHALELDRIGLIMANARQLSSAELSTYRELIRRRRAQEPIAYILGQREFYGLRFTVDRRVLIPRADSEVLVEVALRRTLERSMHGYALDLCTGSGCIAIALAKERPTWNFVATDVSAAALQVAANNALSLGAARNVQFVEGDLWVAVERAQRFDLITCNPPYIPDAEKADLDQGVVGFEPHLALFGGPDGLSIMDRVISESRERLSEGGVLAVEICWDQGPRVTELFKRSGFDDVELNRDYAGRDRVVSGRNLSHTP